MSVKIFAIGNSARLERDLTFQILFSSHHHRSFSSNFNNTILISIPIPSFIATDSASSRYDIAIPILRRYPPYTLLSSPGTTRQHKSSCLTATEADTAEAVEAAVAEDTRTEMGTTTAERIAQTTPVDIPTGMKTYGLDIVVKFSTFRRLVSRSDQGVALHRVPAFITSCKAATLPCLSSFGSFDSQMLILLSRHSGGFNNGGGNVNGFSGGGGYGGGNSYGGGQGGDRMSALGANLQKQSWGEHHRN